MQRFDPRNDWFSGTSPAPVFAVDVGTGPVPADPGSIVPEPDRLDDSSGGQLTADEYHAWRGFLRAHQALFRVLDEELEQATGVPFVHYDVLVQLANAGGRLRMRDLAGRLLVSRSGATRLIDRMERDGHVVRERCSQDGRGQYAVLTVEGLAALEASRPTHLKGVRRRFLGQIDDQQLLAVGAAFTRILRELERETGESLL
ncbi:MAG: MarR family winged helix-turn-helix transcriptional regulator [Solirubrobacteraceae bacterium]|nr:MarR family winged helix-turn-helix transcriptional regulator [Solirubrobacteraceae bacterium]